MLAGLFYALRNGTSPNETALAKHAAGFSACRQALKSIDLCHDLLQLLYQVLFFRNATKGRTLELESQAYHYATATPSDRGRHVLTEAFSTAVGRTNEQSDSC